MARNPHGIPVWYELIADDPDAAQRFYGSILGWGAQDSGTPGIDYRLLGAGDDAHVAGLMRRAEAMPPATWLIYFGVDDVDAAAAKVTAAGGAVHMPPMTMPGVGRMAMATDPQGHAFYLMRGEPDEPSRAFQAYAGPGSVQPGHGVWNELTAADPDAAMAFYGGVLGLRHEGGMPMGDLGEYRFVHAGDTCIGASMTAQPDWPGGWQPYFLVDDIDAAAARIGSAGGRVVQGPDPIPGGDFSVVAADPAGVRFGLVGPRR
ncbi:VOC family protein [Sphingomonas sp.]|uniref:VOC family protein n=1 Tax=Sphingomonas sp. TaxID=28214 RepID=UPI002B551F10|nr:VOC family protein [Sphingomonas sp.]HTG39111.1 VOC family protein [Sphingomonas sp.]